MGSITFLPLDLSGKARVNLREAEPHVLIKVGDKPNRACVLNHGAFYSKGLLVRDATGRALIQGVDYKTTYNYNTLSELTAKEVMGLIVIINTAVVSPVAVTYQAVGGSFSISVKELKALLAALSTDNFRLTWEEIIGKPTEYVPADHEHDWWQTYGMESLTTEIDRIAAAWKQTTTAIVSENNTFGDSYVAVARAAVTMFDSNVRAHLANVANAHGLTKEQIGLDAVNNWTMADGAQVVNRNDNSHYFPIGGAYRILNTGFIQDLNAHITNRSNPHGTSAADASCYTKPVANSLFSNKYLWTDVAVDTKLFQMRNQATLRQDVIYDLNAADVNAGKFTLSQIGGNSGILNPAAFYDYALCGDGNWRKWSDLVKSYTDGRYRMIALGSVDETGATSALTLLRTYYTTEAYPAGTYAFATLYQQPSPDVIYDKIFIYQRIGNDWQLLF